MKAIIATNLNSQIGTIDGLPWHCKMDMRWFKMVTLDHTVIMGRKTMETLKGPLPDRTNLVLSKTLPAGDRNGFTVVNEIHHLPEDLSDVFIIGGKEIYELFRNDIRELHVSTIDAEPETQEGAVFIDLTKLTSKLTMVDAIQKDSRTYKQLAKQLKLKKGEAEESSLLSIRRYSRV